MKRIALLFVSVITLIAGTSTTLPAQQVVRGQAVFPLDTLQWPRFPGKISVTEMARLRLHPVVLDTATMFLNEYRSLNRFVIEMFKPGTIVLADTAGIPRYKADCVNRLAFVSCPFCQSGAGNFNLFPSEVGGRGGVSTSQLFADSSAKLLLPMNYKGGFLDSFREAFRRASDATGSFLGGLAGMLPWLLLLLVLLVLLYLLGRGLRAVFGGRGASGALAPAPAATTSVVTPVPAPVPTPVVLPVVAQPATAPVATPPVAVPVAAPVFAVSEESATPEIATALPESDASADQVAERTIRFRRDASGAITLHVPEGVHDVSVVIE